MSGAKKGTTEKGSQKKPISRKEKLILTTLLVLLVIAIACVSVFLLYPRLAGRPDWQILMSLDFNDSTWIEDMVYNRIKPTEKTIDINSSFVYSQDTAYITAAYASSASVEDAKSYYLAQIPGSVDNEAGEMTRMDVMGEKNGEDDMFTAYDTKVTIDSDKAAQIKDKLIKEFPQQVLGNIPELAGILAGEKLGGYVMYNDDELSSYSYAGYPIFSVAYRYAGTKDELSEVQKTMKAKYTDSIMFEDADAVYIKDQGYIISFTITESDLNYLAVITVQRIPENAVSSVE